MATLGTSGSTLHALKSGDSFIAFDVHGDIHGETDGLFRNDTRVLSRLQLRLGDTEPSLLSSAIGQDSVFFTAHLTNRPLPMLGDASPAKSVIHLERTRFLWDERMYERIACVNYADTDVQLPLQLEFDADFRDMFEVRGVPRSVRGQKRPTRLAGNAVVLSYEGLDRQVRTTAIAFSETPWQLTIGSAFFLLDLPRRERRELYLEIGDHPSQPTRARFREAAAQARWTMRALRRSGARLNSNARSFNAWLERSRADIALLVSRLPTGLYPYAGIPWFSAPFGRDAIFTALQMLWLDPSLACGVLQFLARHQAQETSAFRDSAPGKIMHESRKGEMSSLGEVPFGRYYGGVDTTPLFVMLASAYHERTGDNALVDVLWPALVAAIQWIECRCDADADGLLTYARGQESGLANQGWKDSEDSIFDQDGAMARGPIALVEVQGYAFAALRAMAALAARRNEPDAAMRWSVRADALRATIEQRFWDETLDYYGIARTGDGRLCRVRASNVGHLLYVGLPERRRASRVITQLSSAAFDGGWGIRTLASDQPRYNPMSYHNGSVWPHDVALCAAGMARYGARDEAVRLLTEIFEAAAHFGMRLPELYCGFQRIAGEPPTAYPVACLPQAWSAGSVFMMLQACLGLSVDGEQGKLVIDHPLLPSGIDRLALERVDVGGTSVDLFFERVDDRVVAARTRGARDVRIDVHL